MRLLEGCPWYLLTLIYCAFLLGLTLQMSLGPQRGCMSRWAAEPGLVSVCLHLRSTILSTSLFSFPALNAHFFLLLRRCWASPFMSLASVFLSIKLERWIWLASFLWSLLLEKPLSFYDKNWGRIGLCTGNSLLKTFGVLFLHFLLFLNVWASSFLSLLSRTLIFLVPVSWGSPGRKEGLVCP